MSTAPDEPKNGTGATTTITARVSMALAEMIDADAQRRGVNRSRCITEIVAAYFEGPAEDTSRDDPSRDDGMSNALVLRLLKVELATLAVLIAKLVGTKDRLSNDQLLAAVREAILTGRLRSEVDR